MLRFRLVAGVAVSLIVLSSCGYRFAVEGPGPVIGGGPAPIQNGPPLLLAVRSFENRTLHPNLETKYTTYVRQEMASSSGAHVVYDETGADFLMKGEIVSVVIPSLTFSPTTTREGRVQVVVRVTVEDRKTGKLLWEQSATGVGEFFIGSASNTAGTTDTLQFNQVLQDRALEQAGQDVAQQLAGSLSAARDQGVFTAAPVKSDSLKPPPVSPSSVPRSVERNA